MWPWELRPTRNFLWMHLQEPEIFLGSWVTCFWGDPSCHTETPTSIFYKEVCKQKWYQKRLLIALEESHEEYLHVSLQGYFALMWRHEPEPQETQSSRWLQEKDAEQSAPTHARHTHCTPRWLGTTANWKYDILWDWLWDPCLEQGYIQEPNCEGFFSKEGPHYCIEQSARNPLECDQVQRALGKSSRSCHRTSNNQPWFMSLEIPWGFLAWAILCWLSKGLCHTRKCQLEDIMREEKVWFAIAQWTFPWETFGKRRKWERNLVVSLLPGSHKCLNVRKPRFL